MDSTSDPRSPVELFSKPTSVFLCGNCGAVLNWVAFAIASRVPGSYYWIDVRHGGQLLDPLDPLARGAIPTDQLSVHLPGELAPNEPAAGAATPGGVQPGERAVEPEQRADFLRLPPPVQALVLAKRSQEPPMVLVLSNTHRLAAFYPSATVGPVVRAILALGVSMLFTFADAPPEGRFAFEHIWQLQAIDPLFWRQARFRVERGDASDPVPPGAEIELERLPVVSAALAEVLDQPPKPGNGG